ncbi:MAG TPA: GNAT family N-acetyltransferase [Mycobacteriales bacterium]|nr:GNAT family N-acetyltransferase [Mycobacteriales bacterium]
MVEVRRDFSPRALTAAIEDNTAEMLMGMGAVGGGDQRDDGAVRWSIGGSPIDYHNCVVVADLDPAETDAVIAESTRLMQDRGVPGSWHVGPSMRPADLGERLLRAGFSYGGEEPGMAVDLRLVPHRELADLQVRRVRDRDELGLWARTLARGFGEGQPEADWVEEIYGRLGFAENGRWRHYLGFTGGEPVATSSLFLGAGVAGVYFVMTVPEARRQGIGAAITAAALHDAEARGYRIGVLAASAAGRRVYARLGFAEYCRFDLYEWTPAS